MIAAHVLLVLVTVPIDAGRYIQSEDNTRIWLSTMTALLIPGLEFALGLLVKIILWNPTVYCWPGETGCSVSAGIDKLLPYFVDILTPLYIAAILFTGLYYIVKSTNPRGRARAKSMLGKLLYSMVLVAMSPILYQSLLDISGMLTYAIYQDPTFGVANLDRLISASTGGELFGLCCMVLQVWFIIIFALIMSIIRYFFVIAFASIFPILLFLYFFDLTRGWGRRYVKEALNWIFTPPVQMLWLGFSILALDSTGPVLSAWWPAIWGTELMGALISLGMAEIGFCMVALTPLIMNQLMNLVGGGIFALGVASNTPWVAAMGGIMQGRQDSGLHAAKSVLTRATPTASAFRAIQYGYGAGMGRMNPGLAPGTISRMGGGSGGGGSGGGGGGDDESPSGDGGGSGGGGGSGDGGGPGGGGGPSGGGGRRVDRRGAANLAKKELDAINEGTGATQVTGFDPNAPVSGSGRKRKAGTPRTLREATNAVTRESRRSGAGRLSWSPDKAADRKGRTLAPRVRPADARTNPALQAHSMRPNNGPSAGVKPFRKSKAQILSEAQSDGETEVAKATSDAFREIGEEEGKIAFDETMEGYTLENAKLEKERGKGETKKERARRKAKKKREKVRKKAEQARNQPPSQGDT